MTITTVNPKWIATSVAATAEMTDAHPLTPHAHGIKDSECLPSSESPIGKGIPIAKAKGAMSTTEAAIFMESVCVSKKPKM